MDNIDKADEWLDGCLEDQKENELAYEQGDLDWGIVSTTVRAHENIHGLRGSSSSSRPLYKGKAVHTTSSSQIRTLIGEESEEEDEEQYNEMDLGL